MHWLGLVRCATLCCLLVLLAGCASSSIDVLPDDSEGRGYYVGMALELRADRLVQKPSCSLCPGESPSLVARALIQHDKLYGGHVEDVSVDAYRRDPDAYANWIVGVAPAGTRVEVTRVVRRSAFLGLEATYEVLARFVSGSYSGTTIHLDSVSRYGVDRRPNVDPTELSIVR